MPDKTNVTYLNRKSIFIGLKHQSGSRAFELTAVYICLRVTRETNIAERKRKFTTY